MPDAADLRDDDRAPRYDDYDRPRKSGGSSGLLIGLIVGAVVLIGLCVVLGLFLLLVPAVQKVREAAARSQEQNNMKQIALGFHNDADVTGGLYAPFAHDQRGAVKKGLSHRVSLLPYMEQQNLYRSFQLDQEWDAAANRMASDAVVVTYTTPLDAPPTAKTPFRSFVGGGALFNEDGSPVKFVAITDGTSNTILFVHARDQVPWAQPKELPFGAGTPLPQLGHQSQSNGYNVAMADGSVRFVQSSVSQQTLRALITRNGAEAIGPDW